MIPGVPQVGGVELLILLTIILLFVGAKRVPDLGRSLGNSVLEFRKGASEDHDEKEEVPHQFKESSEPATQAEARPSEARPQAEGHPHSV